jgi:hypothetical protein
MLLIATSGSMALIEGVATFWLSRLASQEQFRLYGTLEQNQERFKERGQSVSRYSPHRYLGFVPSPGYRRGENYHNSQGYRGDPIPTPKAKGEFRIFCLGGSTTYTTVAEHPSQAYPAALETELHKRGYDHVRVINAGAEGWTTFESLINFQLRVADFEPDMIVVYHGINDAIGRVVLPSRAYRGDNSGFIRHTALYNKPIPLWERSTIVRIVQTLLGDRTSPLELLNTFSEPIQTAAFWSYLYQAGEGTYPSGIFTDYPLASIFKANKPIYFERNLNNLVASSANHGATAVLATFALSENYNGSVFASSTGSEETRTPNRYAVALSAPEFAKAIEEQNEIVLKIGERDDVHAFDFANAFPHDANFFVDPIHVNEAGARAKGKLFAEYLLSEGLVPKAR